MFLILIDGVEHDHADTLTAARAARDAMIYNDMAPAETITIQRTR